MLGSGEQCVMTAGTCGTLLWSAGSWAAGELGSQTPLWTVLAGVLVPSGWMMWGVRGQKLHSLIALPLPGGSTTALTMRTLVSPALVRSPSHPFVLGGLLGGGKAN